MDKERFPKLWELMQLPVPKGRVAQIHAFATDLAVGFEEGVWGLQVRVVQGMGGVNWMFTDERANKYPEHFEALRSKWSEDNQPDFYAMHSFGYLISDGGKAYILTEKAMQLVDSPPVPPNVFISYKRSESSAFALLLEARIKYETTATPFMDKSIEPGDDWHPQLEEKVKSSETFICVMGPSTMDSPYVQNEIRWAQNGEQNKLIIPVWHNEYDGSHEKDPLQGKQAVIVESENALNYDSALNQILNRLEYSPQFIAQRQSG